MSILLLTNPFAPQQPPPTSGAPGPAGVDAPAPTAAGPAAVQPSARSGAQNNSGSSTSYSGSGAGAGGSAAQQRLGPSSRLVSPTDAAPASIVSAQVATQAPMDDSTASQTGLPSGRRDSAPIDGWKQPADVTEFRRSETARELPDPLPTSPFLKRNENAA